MEEHPDRIINGPHLDTLLTLSKDRGDLTTTAEDYPPLEESFHLLHYMGEHTIEEKVLLSYCSFPASNGFERVYGGLLMVTRIEWEQCLTPDAAEALLKTLMLTANYQAMEAGETLPFEDGPEYEEVIESFKATFFTVDEDKFLKFLIDEGDYDEDEDQGEWEELPGLWS